MKDIKICKFDLSHSDKLIEYYNHLNESTKTRFFPHAFNNNTLKELFNNENYFMFIALYKQDIIAYSICKIGWLAYEQERLNRYGLTEYPHNDIVYAPSVADDWQGKGLGGSVFQYLTNDVKSTYTIKRIFLWGGVQKSNINAIHFYQKHGFKILGYFDCNGKNVDMMLYL